MIIDDIRNENIVIRPNNTFTLTLVYRRNGVLQNTTGFKTYLQIRQYPGAPRLIFQASHENAMITFGGLDGKIHITIPKEKTRDMTKLFKKAYYDVLTVNLDEVGKTILQGLIELDMKYVTIL